MTWWAIIAGSDLVQSLGWTLAHFLWQGALIAMVLAVVLAVLHNKSANARYLAACVALAVAALSPIATFTHIYAGNVSAQTAGNVSVSTDFIGANRDMLVQPANAVRTEKPSLFGETVAASSLSSALPFFVIAWLVGVIVRAFRLFDTWLREERFRSFGVELADEKLRWTCSRLAEKLNLRVPVSVLLSSIVDVPMIIGWIRPSLLLPAALVTNLNPCELEALIAHELAHLRRHDYLVHLLQCAVKTVLFYHPGVWWISHQMTIERENCCDDIAVELGNKIKYAQALASLDTWRCERFHIAMAASGASLQARLARLDAAYVPSANPSKSRRHIAFAIAFGSVLVGSLAAWQAVRLNNHEHSISNDNVLQRSIEITNFPKVVVSHPPVPFDQLRRSESNSQEILWDGEQILKFSDSVPPGVRSKSVWIRSPVQEPLQVIVIPATQSAHSTLIAEWKTPAGTLTSDSDGGSGRGGRLQILLSDRLPNEPFRLNIFPHSTHDFDGPTGGEYIVCVRHLRDINDIDPETIGIEASPIVLDDSGRAALPRPNRDANGAPVPGHVGIDYSGDVDVYELSASSSTGLRITLESEPVKSPLSLHVCKSDGRLLNARDSNGTSEVILPPIAEQRLYILIAGASPARYSIVVNKQ